MSIVIDNNPSVELSGRLGLGNASVTVHHSYGNLALALTTTAPSIFAGITTQLGSAGPLDGSGSRRVLGGREDDACLNPGDGESEVTMQWPAGFEWMDPTSPFLAHYLP